MPPDWPTMAVRVEFKEHRSPSLLNTRDRCVRGGCPGYPGTGSGKAASSGWELQSFNASDPVEVTLAARLRESAAMHIAGSTAEAYRGPWNHFVDWCAYL